MFEEHNNLLNAWQNRVPGRRKDLIAQARKESLGHVERIKAVLLDYADNFKRTVADNPLYIPDAVV